MANEPMNPFEEEIKANEQDAALIAEEFQPDPYAYTRAAQHADAISRIAAMGQQYKDRLSQNYATNRFNFQTKRADMATDGAQAVASGIANAGGVVGDLIGGIDWGGGKASGGFATESADTDIDYEEDRW